MALEAGRYDDLCEYALSYTQADAALVIVVNGNKGNGCSTKIRANIANILLVTDLMDLMSLKLKKDFKEGVVNYQEVDSECSTKLRIEGKPYPRTCNVCGLGPCKLKYVVNK